jgi:hypothetical protein
MRCNAGGEAETTQGGNVNDGDERQQQELEEERERLTLEALARVDTGLATHDDVLFLASELGLTTRLAA